jgi:2-polyprenyl-6-methoxyphenol hydroxylase-like FAD-dependent oxidoreductase
MAHIFDICIRGGGITGRTLALLLARERLRVALVAPASGTGQAISQATGHSDVRAYALNRASRTLLESLRAWPGAAHANPVKAMRVRGDDGGDVSFLAGEAGAEALAWIVDVPALEAQLAQAVQYQPSIEVVAAPVPAALTVVCEGRASASRDEFGAAFDIAPYGHDAIATRVVGDMPHGNVAHQWFHNGEILGLLPLGDAVDGVAGNSMAVVWSVPHDRALELLQLDATAFCQALQTASRDAVGAMTMTAERASWPLQLSRATHWIGRHNTRVDDAQLEPGPAWALAGDAAHTVHPLSGQGLNLGLADVAELGRLIAGRESWRSVADLRLLRRYERARRLDAALLAGATDGLQRLFAQSGKLWQVVRNGGMNSFERSGPLKQWVVARAMGR